MDSNRTFPLLVICILIIHTGTFLASASSGTGLHGHPCETFKDCKGAAGFTCKSGFCQCNSFQYFEPSLQTCVSKLGQSCDLDTTRDFSVGLPKLVCLPGAKCDPKPKPKSNAFGVCQCPPNREPTLDGKCAEPVRRTPAPVVSHPKFADEQRDSHERSSINIASSRDEKLEDFPFTNSERVSHEHMTRNGSGRTNCGVTTAIPLLLVCLRFLQISRFLPTNWKY